jgi:hypothetical protein
MLMASCQSSPWRAATVFFESPLIAQLRRSEPVTRPERGREETFGSSLNAPPVRARGNLDQWSPELLGVALDPGGQ